MCGIAGLLDFAGAPPDRATLLGMLARIAHRGPDGGGWMSDEGGVVLEGTRESSEPARRSVPPPRDGSRGAVATAALGHQRLAITDLTDAGRQPMCRDGRWWIVFNGAIYNATELRAELEREGERFTSSTDTEVLLAAWIRWGVAALDRFNGMWAFAIWDASHRELVCARDRYGVKPFFHTSAGNLFAFASEPKALRAVRPARPNLSLVRDYLAVGSSIPGGEETAFADYRSLPPGCVLRVRGGETLVERWYDLDARTSGLPPPASFGDAAERLRELLDDAVAIRLRADVPIGAFLSGGVDSSAIVGTLAASHRDGFSGRTISLRYPGRPEIDESPYAEAALAASGFRGDFVEPTTSGFDRDLDDTIATADNFVSGSVFYAQRMLYRRARENGFPVMLSGQGSDELFGGYEPWDVYVAQLWNRGSRRAALREGFLSGRRQWGALTGARHTLGVIRTSRRALRCGCAAEGTLQQHQRHLFVADYLAAIVEHEDRNSMAFGVESRLPFLDYRIVEFARSLPDRYLLRDGWTKAVLREAMKGRVPEAVLRRPRKLGLPGPHERVSATDRELAEAARRRLLSSPWLPPGAVPDRVGPGVIAGMRIRVLDAWLRRCVDAA